MNGWIDRQMGEEWEERERHIGKLERWHSHDQYDDNKALPVM